MEIKKGQIIDEELAEILRNISIPDRKILANKLKIHVNTINNKIIEKRIPIKGKKGVQMIRELCMIALKNNEKIIDKLILIETKLKKLIE